MVVKPEHAAGWRLAWLVVVDWSVWLLVVDVAVKPEYAAGWRLAWLVVVDGSVRLLVLPGL